ncbi:hypothetical protein ACJQWK_05813 [Exserohilum turcicum]
MPLLESVHLRSALSRLLPAFPSTTVRPPTQPNTSVSPNITRLRPPGIMSNIHILLLSWFPKRQPTSLICGLELTLSRATSLLSLAQSLSHSLRLQKSAIQAFQTLTGLRSITALRAIQEQHAQIHKSLSTLTIATASSSQPWLHELSDVQTSMQRKVRVCNQASTSSHVGRTEAAKIYWPVIAETYDFLLDLLASFEQEITVALKNKDMWKSGMKRKLIQKTHLHGTQHRSSAGCQSQRKRVRFDTTVKGRYHHCTMHQVPTWQAKRRAKSICSVRIGSFSSNWPKMERILQRSCTRS